jgi:hypothetical protein
MRALLLLVVSAGRVCLAAASSFCWACVGLARQQPIIAGKCLVGGGRAGLAGQPAPASAIQRGGGGGAGGACVF